MSESYLIVIGASHKSAPLELLEQVSLSPEEIERYLVKLKSEASLSEIVLLSTCNRTEIYARAENRELSVDILKKWLLSLCKEEGGLAEQNLYCNYDKEAVIHLFKTACGLDSMILGETEITGQVQDALELAQKCGTTGSYTIELFSRAFRSAKRARTETKINSGTTSIPSAAVHLAKRIFGDLSQRSILIVGAGETGKLLCTYFSEHSPARVVIANRTHDNAAKLSDEFGFEAIPLDDITSVLGQIDVSVCATYSKQPLITDDMVKEAMKNRGERMLLLVDISLPHNIDREASKLDNVFLHNMNDLKSIVANNLKMREKEVDDVLTIIEEERKEFEAKRATMKVGPLIKSLREHYDDLRKAELERFSSKIPDDVKPIADRLTRDLMNKLLHWPTLGIREISQNTDNERKMIEWSKKLFGLDRDDGEKKSE